MPTPTLSWQGACGRWSPGARINLYLRKEEAHMTSGPPCDRAAQPETGC